MDHAQEGRSQCLVRGECAARRVDGWGAQAVREWARTADGWALCACAGRMDEGTLHSNTDGGTGWGGGGDQICGLV